MRRHFTVGRPGAPEGRRTIAMRFALWGLSVLMLGVSAGIFFRDELNASAWWVAPIVGAIIPFVVLAITRRPFVAGAREGRPYRLLAALCIPMGIGAVAISPDRAKISGLVIPGMISVLFLLAYGFTFPYRITKHPRIS